MKRLGVEINLAKSIISHKGYAVEFAKRTLYKYVDVSPIPFKEVRSYRENIGTLKEMVRKYNLTFSQVLRFLGYGYRTRLINSGKHVTNLKLFFLYPCDLSSFMSFYSLVLEKIKANTDGVSIELSSPKGLYSMCDLLWQEALKYEKEARRKSGNLNLKYKELFDKSQSGDYRAFCQLKLIEDRAPAAVMELHALADQFGQFASQFKSLLTNI
jgi:hypothetical protein